MGAFFLPRAGGVKFIGYVLGLVASSVLAWSGSIGGVEWVAFNGGAFAVLCGSNAYISGKNAGHTSGER